jgi:hypothetical protein
MLPVGEPIQDGHLDIGITIKYQTNLVWKVGSVNEKVHFLAPLDMPNRALRQLLIEVTFEVSYAVTTPFGEMLDALFSRHPFPKPNELVSVGNVASAVGEIAAAILAKIARMTAARTLVNGVKSRNGDTVNDVFLA